MEHSSPSNNIRSLITLKSNTVVTWDKPKPKPVPRFCHPGGQMKTNKEEAMAKFLERKKEKGMKLSETEKKLLELGKKSIRNDTIYVETRELVENEKVDLRTLIKSPDLRGLIGTNVSHKKNKRNGKKSLLRKNKNNTNNNKRILRSRQQFSRGGKKSKSGHKKRQRSKSITETKSSSQDRLLTGLRATRNGKTKKKLKLEGCLSSKR
eukprot:g2998.t1